MFRVEEQEGRGKLLIATLDMLPGTIVLEESDPLMTISNEYLEKYKAHVPESFEGMVAAFSVFKKIMKPEQTASYLQLFGPTEGGFADEMRRIAAKTFFPNTAKELLPLSASDRELMVRVASIYRINAFVTQVGNAVYDTASRMSHSCVPNCEPDFEGNKIIVRALQPIRVGDDLSIAYNSARALKTTAERRHKCMLFKDFTCHCTRCDAPGDDTRQFDCFDPNCAGRHYACQPLSDKPLTYSHHRYTGVEYVEPYLLPCTACQRPPPVEYQARMLAEEKRWEAQLGKWEAELTSMLEGSPAKILSRLSELEAMEMPRWHRRTIQHRKLHSHLSVRIMGVLATAPETCNISDLYFDLTEAMYGVDIAQHILPLPERHSQQELYDAAVLCNYLRSYELAKPYCQRAIRMQLIRFGREKRHEQADALLLEALQKLPAAPVIDSTSCAFCEESPERAAMKRSRSGACKAVMYCSVGCQKAHWKIHKAQCKKV